MTKLVNMRALQEIAEIEFGDMVVSASIPGTNELRIILKDGSFVDVWFSLKLSDRFSFHWERRALDGKIYRHDNAPHIRWQAVSTFPQHFHDGSETQVIESRLSSDPAQALRQFLEFIRLRLRSTP